MSAVVKGEKNLADFQIKIQMGFNFHSFEYQ